MVLTPRGNGGGGGDCVVALRTKCGKQGDGEYGVDALLAEVMVIDGGNVRVLLLGEEGEC